MALGWLAFLVIAGEMMVLFVKDGFVLWIGLAVGLVGMSAGALVLGGLSGEAVLVTVGGIAALALTICLRRVAKPRSARLIDLGYVADEKQSSAILLRRWLTLMACALAGFVVTALISNIIQ